MKAILNIVRNSNIPVLFFNFLLQILITKRLGTYTRQSTSQTQKHTKCKQENVHLLSNGHFQCITYARHYLNSSKEKKVKSTKIIVDYNDIIYFSYSNSHEKTHTNVWKNIRWVDSVRRKGLQHSYGNWEADGWLVYKFLMTDLNNYNKLGDLVQHTLIPLQCWR